MPGIDIKGRVKSKLWLTPSVFELGFCPSKKFKFEAGQFLSVTVPGAAGTQNLKRAYSFANSYEDYKKSGEIKLCIKLVEDGAGSAFMASLREGDEFSAKAPFGDFCYRGGPEDYSVCFISTGSGIAPFRAMVESQEFRDHMPKSSLCLFGARCEEELLYQDNFKNAGVNWVAALSRPSNGWTGFHGRVTDYLKSLPMEWPWHKTVYYLCGNGTMINDARDILCNGHGIPESQIFYEAYFDAGSNIEIKIAS